MKMGKDQKGLLEGVNESVNWLSYSLTHTIHCLCNGADLLVSLNYKYLLTW